MYAAGLEIRVLSLWVDFKHLGSRTLALLLLHRFSEIRLDETCRPDRRGVFVLFGMHCQRIGKEGHEFRCDLAGGTGDHTQYRRRTKRVGVRNPELSKLDRRPKTRRTRPSLLQIR